MYPSQTLDKKHDRNSHEIFSVCIHAAAILILLCLGWSPSARGQTREEADFARPSFWAGGEISGYRIEYGDRKMWGGSAWVDADPSSHIGIEAEGRWLEFHQTANVHLETFMIGPRCHRDLGKFQPFVKGTVGFGNFNFPYNYASGRYLAIGAGGGVDFRLKRRWSMRLAEVQYQEWPNFTFGSMNSIGVSSGVRFRVF